MAKSSKNKKIEPDQFGVLPFRVSDEGVEVLMITSRRSRRWIIPKGWPMKGRTPLGAAAREGFEEAGVYGDGLKPSLGVFKYVKRVNFGRTTALRIEVFPLAVTEVLDAWPEQAERERRWMSVAEAADAVPEDDLKAIIRALPERIKAEAAKETAEADAH
ncbi:NUDIX hydrolase [Methylopila musalis]|uniref:NUDIX hydrolase n=1 Tax=Methylopila musalis TaxID=1134781 RepID=A0ABW3Z614_9HYPH